MSCAATSPSPLSASSPCHRPASQSTNRFQAHQHSANSSCVNVAPPPQCPANRKQSTSSATSTTQSQLVCTCSPSCRIMWTTASVDSKCPYMRRVAQDRIAASIKNEASNHSTSPVLLTPPPSSAATITSTRAAASSANKPNGASTSSRSPSSSSSTSAAPLVRGDEYSLYRLSKSAALQAASKGIQLTLVAPNSRFPSTPSSHSLHDHDNDASSNSSNHNTNSHTTDNSAPTATAADGTAYRSATITTTITTRIRTVDGETGQSSGLVISTTKRATIRSAL